MHQLADRLSRLSESATLKMARLSRELQEKGENIINLSLGEPDYDTPQHVKEAGIKAIQDGYTSYPPVPGYPELREAVTQKYQRDLGLSYEPGQVVVSTGAKQCLINILLSLVNEEDEVLVPSPYWVSYPEMIKMAGGKMVTIDTTVKNDYKITPQELDEAITECTKVFMLCSPSNPTGSIYSREELAELAAVLKHYPHVHIISDEIYDYINFTGEQCSLAQFGDLQDRTIIVNGVSKSFAMTGWRIGFMVGPQWISDGCIKIQGQFTSGANAMAQQAARVAINSDLSPTYAMRDGFQKRRDLVMRELNNIPGIRFNRPAGAFYLFPDISGLYGRAIGEQTVHDSEAFCMAMLETAKVSLVPGIAFGNDDCMRISFAASEDELSEAMRRIQEALV